MSILELKNQIENQIRSLEKTFDSVKFDKQATELASQQLLKTASKLGGQLGEVKGGFKALTASIDDVDINIATSKLDQVAGELNIAQMTGDVRGVTNQLVQDVGSAATDLTKITGESTSTSSGQLNVVITLPTTAAVAAAVKEVTTATTEQLEAIAKDLVDVSKPLGKLTSTVEDTTHDTTKNLKSVEGELKKAIGEVTGVSNNVEAAKSLLVKEINQDVTNALNAFNKGFNSVAENIVEDLLTPATIAITSVATKNGISVDIPQSKVNEIIALTTDGKILTAAKVLQKYSDKSREEVLNAIKSIDNRLSKTLAKSSPVSIAKSKQITDNENKWSGATTKKDAFTVVGSKEELEADILSAKREITEVIVHHSFSGTNQNLSAEDLNEIAKEVYNDGIGYHYVINRDGNIERGRPISRLAPALVNGHEQYSIQICFVGGIDAPVGSQNMTDVERWVSKKSFTAAQWKSFKIFLDSVYKAFPGIQVMGHSDIDREQLDPTFNVIEYVESTYNKKLIFNEPHNQPPLSQSELIKRLGPQ